MLREDWEVRYDWTGVKVWKVHGGEGWETRTGKENWG